MNGVVILFLSLGAILVLQCINLLWIEKVERRVKRIELGQIADASARLLKILHEMREPSCGENLPQESEKEATESKPAAKKSVKRPSKK